MCKYGRLEFDQNINVRTGININIPKKHFPVWSELDTPETKMAELFNLLYVVLVSKHAKLINRISVKSKATN